MSWPAPRRTKTFGRCLRSFVPRRILSCLVPTTSPQRLPKPLCCGRLTWHDRQARRDGNFFPISEGSGSLEPAPRQPRIQLPSPELGKKLHRSLDIFCVVSLRESVQNVLQGVVGLCASMKALVKQREGGGGTKLPSLCALRTSQLKRSEKSRLRG